MKTTPRAWALTITGTIIAVASVLMLAFMGRAVAGLVLALVVSFLLALRPIPVTQLRDAAPAYVAAVCAQAIHLVEEYRTGFYATFPPLLGTSPWSAETFLVFNLAWLLVFALAAIGVMLGWQPTTVVALFLAIGGGILNGIAHAVFAVGARGYFPGLYTAPLVFAAGLYLAYRLLHRSRESTG